MLSSDPVVGVLLYVAFWVIPLLRLPASPWEDQ